MLTAEERELVHEQRRLFDASLDLFRDVEMLPDDAATLHTLRAQLDELFLVVVVGEFNSGKSTFLNALLGEELLETGDLPTTRQVHLLRHGPVRSEREVEPGLLVHELPVELLRDLEIVDTPGTNSMQREEQALTERFVPRADLVFFLTSLVRPYTASEDRFLHLLRDWGKRIVLVVNQVDLARDAEQVERVRRYVAEQARVSLGEERPVYAIAALEVLRARRAEGARELGTMNEYPKLEEYVTGTLRQRERVQLKLRAPLETLETRLARLDDALAERLRLLHGDRQALEGLLEAITSYEERMRGEVERYGAQVTNVLWHLEKRGRRFFDDLVRFGNLLRLRDKDVVENRFRNEVVADAPARIEEEIQGLIDWLVRQNLGMWEKADETLRRRREALREVARRTRWLSPEYVYNREEIFRNLAQPVRRRLEAFDAREEADAIVESVNHALARTFGVQALVLGAGAVLTAAFTSLTIDVTGTIGATLLAVAGLFILPQRRARLKRQLGDKVERLRQDLLRTLNERFGGQLQAYVGQLRETFTPELEATRSQVERLEGARERLRGLRTRCRDLVQRVESG